MKARFRYGDAILYRELDENGRIIDVKARHRRRGFRCPDVCYGFRWGRQLKEARVVLRILRTGREIG